MILKPQRVHLRHDLAGREQVQSARRLARLALGHCASELGLADLTPSFPRDKERAPQPMQLAAQTWYWSTTNTKALVAAVLAPAPVGIDAEWLGRTRLGALKQYLSKSEVQAMALPEPRAQLALWSAKEAVIKLTGIGMAAMGRTQLEGLLAADYLSLSLDGKSYRVRQNWSSEHVLSVACLPAPETKHFQIELSTPLELENATP